MESLISIILSKETGVGTLFLSLFLMCAYYLRKDSKEHKEEYREVIREMFKVVDKNTESNAKLSESINSLKDRIK